MAESREKDAIANIQLRCESSMAKLNSIFQELSLVHSDLIKIAMQEMQTGVSPELHLKQLTGIKSVVDSVHGSKALLKKALDHKNKMRAGFNSVKESLE